MNPITLDVKLKAENNDKDILVFEFSEDVCNINLNTDSCQGELKEVFSKLIQLSLDNDVTLNFSVEDGYSRGLYKDVCVEYIAELQRELDDVTEKIRNEIKCL